MADQLDVFEIIEDIDQNGIVPGKPEVRSVAEPHVIWEKDIVQVQRRGAFSYVVVVAGEDAKILWSDGVARQYAEGVVWAIENPEIIRAL